MKKFKKFGIGALIMPLLVICLANGSMAGLKEGTEAYKQGDFESALFELRPLAEQGDPIAQMYLGLMYLKGKA